MFAAWAWLSASTVCGMMPSSAATTRIAMSVTWAPRARMAVNASWPGVSMKVMARLVADGAAGACGRRSTGVAGNAERYRRQRISRGADADGVDLHDLAQSRKPGGRGATVVLHARDRSRPDRNGALRPPQRGDRVLRRKPAADAANHACGPQGPGGVRGLPAAGAVRIRRSAAVSDPPKFSARLAFEFRHVAVARCLQLGGVRNACHADCAAARLYHHSRRALVAQCAALDRDERLADRLRASGAGAGARPAHAGAGRRQWTERGCRMDGTFDP